MTSTERPCCRALVGAGLVSYAVAFVQSIVAPTDAGLWVFATLPFLSFAWIAPGLMIAAFVAPRATAPDRVLVGVLASWILFVANHVVTRKVAAAFGSTDVPYALFHAGPGLLTLLLAARLVVRPPKDVRRRDADDARFLKFAGWTFVLVAAASAPFLFSDLSSDGVEARYMARSLAQFSMPRVPGEGALPGALVGMIPQAFVARWFMLAHPGSDLGPRLPLLLFAPLLFSGVVALVEVGTARRLAASALAAVAATTAALAATLALNATFDPYFADIASPGALDFGALVLVLALFRAWFAERTAAFVVVATFAHFARPTVFLSMLCLAAFGPWFLAKGRRLAALLRTGAGIAAAQGAAILYERVYVPAMNGGLPPLEGGKLGSRLRFLEFGDFGRFIWVLVPTGFLAPLALLAWRKQDGPARTLTASTVAVLGLFGATATYAPHHLAPAMVLPVVVLHRVLGNCSDAFRRPATFVVALCAALAFLLAVPRNFAPSRPYSELAARLVHEAPPLERDLPKALASAELLGSLLIPCHASDDPSKLLMGSFLSVTRYSRPDETPLESADFVVRGTDQPPPEGFIQIESELGWTLFARSRDVVEAARRKTPPVDWSSPLLRVDRVRLFRHRVEAEKLYDVDLRALVDRFRNR